MNDGVSRHPPVDVMADFIEGKLAPAEVITVTRHLAECEDCRTVVSESARFEREEEQRATPKRRPWWIAAAAVVAVAIPVMVVQRLGRPSEPMQMLIDAAPREHRILEPRLSGFEYARLKAPSRGSVAADPADLKLGGAAGTVLEQLSSRNDAPARHAVGVAHLITGQPQPSIEALERAATGSEDPKIWNDLAAARYVWAAASERAAQLPLALADVDKALGLDPRFAAALFNRALILERMELREEARKAWEGYLAVDGSSGWATEARARLQKLEPRPQVNVLEELKRARSDPTAIAAVVRAYPEDSRKWTELVLLNEWADAIDAKDRALAAERLGVVRLVANALAAGSGESLLLDAVAAIERSPHTSDLAEAQHLYYEARKAFNARKTSATHAKFERAAELFERGGSPMAQVASYFAASTLMDLNRTATGCDELRAILSGVDARHRALAAQVHWQLAICASLGGDWGSMYREADTASTSFAALGETHGAAYLSTIAAYALDRLGARDEAWSRRIRAFPALDERKRHIVLHAGARTLESIGNTAGSASVLDLVIEGGAGGNRVLLTGALADRARVATRAGETEAAHRALKDSRKVLASLDAGFREVATVNADVGEAVLAQTTDARAALPAFDRAIEFARAHGAEESLPDAYLQRARAHRALGNDTAAAADFATALNELELQQRSVGASEKRAAALDVAEEIVEESVDLHLARNRPADAFAVVERARGSLSEGVTALRYVLLPRRIAVFVVTNEDVTAVTIDADRDRIVSDITDLADLIRGRAPRKEIIAKTAALHRLLIAPVQTRIGQSEELVIVPDRQLHMVPFAALYDERQRQFLAEQFTIRIAHSVATAAPIASGSLAPALVIADPATKHAPRLQMSREEAAGIADLHGAMTLIGEMATRSRVIAGLRVSALVHYAGHADSDFCESYGALLLAPEGRDSGIFRSSEIAQLALTNRPLVVLAGCGTARGDSVHIGGLSSLARAFLDAGARAVVGTLWEVDDDVTAPLFLRFHESLRSGMSPARALRDAQRLMLHSGDERLSHPATWAAIEIIS